MGAEKILGIILKKLKDYKTNPKKSTPQDKAKQENLMKLLHVYSSLKKKEQSKTKTAEQKMKKNVPCNTTLIPQESSHDKEFEVIKCDKELEASDPSKNENISENVQSDVEENNTSTLKTTCSDVNLVVEEQTKMPNTKCDIRYNDGTNVLDDIIMENQLEDDVKFETTILNSDQTAIEDESREDIESFNYIHYVTVDGFLSRLSEGLKRLPYKQRAKLEIEYLRRLYEVQDNLGTFDK